MKKLILLIIGVLFLGTISTQAQLKKNTPSRVSHDKGFTFGLGLKGGLTFTSLTGSLDGGDFYDKSGTGFEIGAFVNSRFGKRNPNLKNSLSGTGVFGLKVEALYKQIAAKTIGDDNLKMGYFEVPVLAQVYPFYKSKNINNIYIEAGPVIAGTMGSNPDVITVDGVRSYAVGDLKGFDVRIAFGAGWTESNTGIGINVRYNIGTSKLAKNFPLKTNILEFALTYRLPYIGIGNNIK